MMPFFVCRARLKFFRLRQPKALLVKFLPSGRFVVMTPLRGPFLFLKKGIAYDNNPFFREQEVQL